MLSLPASTFKTPALQSGVRAVVEERIFRAMIALQIAAIDKIVSALSLPVSLAERPCRTRCMPWFTF